MILAVRPRNRTSIQDCDGSVADTLRTYPNAIPATYQAKPLRPCEEDEGPGLCCYFTPGGLGYRTLGFHFIADQRYIYRVEYGKDKDGKYTVLQMVSRHCKYPQYPEKCPGGEPDVDVGPTFSDPRFPKPTNTSTSTTPSNTVPHLSIDPFRAAKLDNRGILTSTTSRNVTGIPDIYFPTSTWTSSTPSSSLVASVTPVLENPELKIDLGNLDAPGLIDIMLESTNIEEVRQAHLDLSVSADCRTNKEGKVHCNKLVVEMQGHTIGNDTLVPLPSLEHTSTQDVGHKSMGLSEHKSYDLTETNDRSRTASMWITATSTVLTSTMKTTVGIHNTESSTTLLTELMKRLDTPLPSASVSLFMTPAPHFAGQAQAVLGPRAVTSANDWPESVASTVGYKSRSSPESKSKKPKKTRKTKTKVSTDRCIRRTRISFQPLAVRHSLNSMILMRYPRPRRPPRLSSSPQRRRSQIQRTPSQ